MGEEGFREIEGCGWCWTVRFVYIMLHCAALSLECVVRVGVSM